mmetsp:Transcript_20297/g.57642  ORF Transcript_20297/g.57642 Transcript_20297/m.57642 type:complete len:119 (+) Transcript_20297:1437-1793(+)
MTKWNSTNTSEETFNNDTAASTRSKNKREEAILTASTPIWSLKVTTSLQQLHPKPGKHVPVIASKKIISTRMIENATQSQVGTLATHRHRRVVKCTTNGYNIDGINWQETIMVAMRQP